MAELYRSDIVNVDISKSLNRMYVGSVLATGDEYANRFGANVFRAGEPVILDGCSVMGYFVRNERETIVIKGAVSGNMAYVDLPQACYAERGSFSLAIKASSNGVTHTVRIVDGYIRMTQTDVLIDPGDVVPSLDDLFAQIDEMEAVTAKAEETIATIKADAEDAIGATNAAAVYANRVTRELSATVAPPIIPTATGEVITVNDISERKLAGLTLYGKTTQDGTPSPDAPVPLVSVGSGGTIKANACGRNLFDDRNPLKTSASIGHAGATVYQGISGRSVYIPISPLTTYTVKKATSTVMRVATSPDIPAGGGAITACKGLNAAGTDALTITSGESDHYLCVNLFVNTDSSDLLSIDVHLPSLMIEVGETASPYEFYKDGGSVTVSAPNGLPGIPVTSGGNYTDANGQQWICDEVDFARGVYVQRCYKETLSPVYESAYDRYKYGLTYPANMSCGDGAGIMCLCDKLTYSKSAGASTSEIGNGVRVSTTNNKLAVGRYNGNEVGDITIMYPLETPIETELSAEVQTAFYDLMHPYPNTTVYNDAGAAMKLEYIADTKTYIDQRIAALLN